MIDVEYRKQEAAAQSRFQARASIRARTLEVLENASPLAAESDERKRVRLSTIDPHDGLALERLIGASDLLPLSYLEAGLTCARPVCRIEVHDRVGRVVGHGTGFMVSPELMLTNNHVLHDAQTALYSLAQFDYEVDARMQPRPTRNFRLEPERLFLTDEGLDFALVAVAPMAAEGVKLDQYGYIHLIAGSGKALLGECVSIIQHPNGAPKAIAVRANQVTDVFDQFIHYSTDTEPGSSGSPVLSDAWEVVALHHAGVPAPAGNGYVANEGIRISSIMAHLQGASNSLPSSQQAVLRSLLDHQPELPAPAAGEQAVTLERSAYDGLSGYDDDFLGAEHRIALPVLGDGIRDDLAPVPDAEDGVLRYAHFSVVMNRARKLAFYAAVNIDGSALRQIPRSGDKWYFDPRIDRDLQCGPELYANNDLDRGHLVRRLDPVWGRDAARANEHTFHFTNCSPQHRHLNQKTWLELEDYILDNAGRHDLNSISAACARPIRSARRNRHSPASSSRGRRISGSGADARRPAVQTAWCPWSCKLCVFGRECAMTMPTSSTLADSFAAVRPRLFGIAYRMLGTRADAEDVVQDAWLRWNDSPHADLAAPEAWLVTVTTRLAIDRLRTRKTEREAYVGWWLPEPLIDDAHTPETAAELASEVSVAFLWVLERLAPEERAAFLLRQVFDHGYGEIAAMLGKSEAACRQLVHRAQGRVQQDKPRFQVAQAAHRELLARFMQAASQGDRAAMKALLGDDVQLVSDGGGKVASFMRVLQGAGRVAGVYWSVEHAYPGRVRYRPALVNGEPGLLRYVDGRIESAQSFIVDEDRIVAVFVMRNPDKLKRAPQIIS